MSFAGFEKCIHVPAVIMSAEFPPRSSSTLNSSNRRWRKLIDAASASLLNLRFALSTYSALASLRDTDTWVNALTRGDPGRLPQRPDPLARTALGAFLQLSPAATVELFDAFARLPTEQQRVVFDGRGAGFPAALFAQWQAMPPAGRLALIAATARSLLTAR